MGGQPSLDTVQYFQFPKQFCSDWNRAVKFVRDFKRFKLRGKSRDSSVALSYGLDDWGSRVRFPAGAGNFSLHHRVQNGSGTHPAAYPMGTRGSFPRGKAAGA
jgi:hypothetical protein